MSKHRWLVIMGMNEQARYFDERAMRNINYIYTTFVDDKAWKRYTRQDIEYDKI